MKALTKISKGIPAFRTHQELLALKRQMGLAFLRMGRLLKKIKNDELYLALDYPTFRDYLHSPEVEIHWRTAYYYIDIWETFIERLGYKVEELSEYSYDKLRRLLPIVKKKENVKEVMEKALALRRVDFEREMKGEQRNEGFEDYLAPPEFWRCKNCGKWVIVIPEEDVCKCQRQ